MKHRPDSHIHVPRGLCVAIALAMLTCSSCWVQSGSSRPRSLGNRSQMIDRSAVTPRIRGNDGPERGRNIGRTSIPRVNSLKTKEFALGSVNTKSTAKGMTIASRPRPGNTVTINLAIPHRSRTGDENGVATLTARITAETPRAASGKPALRQAVRRLGGTLDIAVDGAASHFTITTHKSRWRAALAELIDAIGTPHRNTRIDDSQRVALIDWSDDYALDPLIGTVDWVSKTTDFDKHPIDGIQDLTSGHVANFQTENYQPAGSVLVIEGAVGGKTSLDVAEQTISQWAQPFADAAEVPPITPLVIRQGTFWATDAAGDATPETVLLVSLPPTASPAEHAEVLIAIEHYISPNGALVPELRKVLGDEFELAAPRWIANGPSSTYMLRGTLDPENAARFIQHLQAAYVQIAGSEPTSTAVLRAAARVRLRMLRDRDAPRRSTRSLARTLMAQPGIEGDKVDAVLAALADPTTLDVGAGFAKIATIPPTVVVCGGAPPRSMAASVTSLGRLRSSTDRAILGAGNQARESAADQFVQRAITANGGVEQLTKIRGFMMQATVETGRGPHALELSGFDAINSMFRRRRTVLATNIDTLVRDGRGTEFVGDESAGIPRDEVVALLERSRQHPLILLSEMARGTTKFRLNSNREVGGRPFVVLERIDDSKPRLRIHVDTESGLIRVVQTVEHLPGIGPASVTAHYRDYRFRLGVRVPFHKTTLIDGTEFGSKTTFASVTPIAPPPALFDSKTR